MFRLLLSLLFALMISFGVSAAYIEGLAEGTATQKPGPTGDVIIFEIAGRNATMQPGAWVLRPVAGDRPDGGGWGEEPGAGTGTSEETGKRFWLKITANSVLKNYVDPSSVQETSEEEAPEEGAFEAQEKEPEGFFVIEFARFCRGKNCGGTGGTDAPDEPTEPDGTDVPDSGSSPAPETNAGTAPESGIIIQGFEKVFLGSGSIEVTGNRVPLKIEAETVECTGYFSLRNLGSDGLNGTNRDVNSETGQLLSNASHGADGKDSGPIEVDANLKLLSGCSLSILSKAGDGGNGGNQCDAGGGCENFLPEGGNGGNAGAITILDADNSSGSIFSVKSLGGGEGTGGEPRRYYIERIDGSPGTRGNIVLARNSYTGLLPAAIEGAEIEVNAPAESDNPVFNSTIKSSSAVVFRSCTYSLDSLNLSAEKFRFFVRDPYRFNEELLPLIESGSVSATVLPGSFSPAGTTGCPAAPLSEEPIPVVFSFFSYSVDAERNPVETRLNDFSFSGSGIEKQVLLDSKTSSNGLINLSFALFPVNSSFPFFFPFDAIKALNVLAGNSYAAEMVLEAQSESSPRSYPFKP